MRTFGYRVRPSAILDVSGEDRESFLQGQLTQDVRLAAPGRVLPAAGLTPKGKLLFAGRLAGGEDRFRLLLPAAVRETARTHLAKYAVFQKVEIADRSDELTRIALYGAVPDPPPEGAVVLPGEGEITAELVVPAPSLAETLSRLDAAGGRALGDEEAEALRVEAGRPEFGVDADQTHLADEAGLSDALSTTKGCYVGQEVVARLRTYGRVNRRLVGFRFVGGPGPLPAGTLLRRPGESDTVRTEAGRVTSAAESPTYGPIGLGYAFRDVAIGDRLVPAGDAPGGTAAVVAALPFA